MIVACFTCRLLPVHQARPHTSILPPPHPHSFTPHQCSFTTLHSPQPTLSLWVGLWAGPQLQGAESIRLAVRVLYLSQLVQLRRRSHRNLSPKLVNCHQMTFHWGKIVNSKKIRHTKIMFVFCLIFLRHSLTFSHERAFTPIMLY